MFYGNQDFPNFVKAPNEQRLQIMLSELQIAAERLIKVISIYPSPNGGVVAWYFHDIKKLGYPKKEKEALVPKKKSVKAKKE